MRKYSGTISILFVLLLSACSMAGDSAAKPVEAYLQAIVDQDGERLSTLVCASWADQAVLEMDAFMGVDATLDNLACSESDVTDSSASVQCTGSIVATYNNEKQQFSLEGRIYQAVKEGGDWLVCGYK